MLLLMNIHISSGNNPFVVLAKASFLTKCKIQTLSVKSNISVSFTPPEVMHEDCVKMLYYQCEEFTVCQRVAKIEMNNGNNDFSKQMGPEFTQLFKKMHSQLFKDYHVVYGYDYSHGIYEFEINKHIPLLQKFERFFEKIPHDSSIVFVFNGMNSSFIPLLVKALLRLLGRKTPIISMPAEDRNISCFRFIPCLTKNDPDQGNLLQIIVIWVVRREGIEPKEILQMFSPQ